MVLLLFILLKMLVQFLEEQLRGNLLWLLLVLLLLLGIEVLHLLRLLLSLGVWDLEVNLNRGVWLLLWVGGLLHLLWVLLLLVPLAH